MMRVLIKTVETNYLCTYRTFDVTINEDITTNFEFGRQDNMLSVTDEQGITNLYFGIQF